MNSMNPTQIILITGRLDCRPNANKIPIGKDATIPVTPTIKDNVKPPIFSDSTKGKLMGKMTSKSPTNGLEAKRKNTPVNKKARKAAIK